MSSGKDLWILGISASHNGAYCLLKGSEIVVAMQEERLSRLKRHEVIASRRSLALDYCLDYAGITPRDLDLIVVAVQGHQKNPINDIRLNPTLQVELNKIPTQVISHHQAHAVAAYATSGFEDSAILVIDGWGSPMEDLSAQEKSTLVGNPEDGWEIISLYGGKGAEVKALEKHLSPNGVLTEIRYDRMPQYESLGGMFTSVSTQIFGNLFEAGKVMGLAPYGEATTPAEDFFEVVDGRFVFKDVVPARYRHNERWPNRREEYQNLSKSVQVALEEAGFYLVEQLRKHCGSDYLCYAGGVALNSVLNERLIREAGFKDIYIQPAAEDSGPCLGAAYHGLWSLTGKNEYRRLSHDAVGRDYSQGQVDAVIEEAPSVELIDTDDLLEKTADLLTEGNIVGWFQGRSELGPRALGQRSILCDPSRQDAKEVLNRRVKHREAFRPFAPVIPVEEVENWFDLGGSPPDSPFMLRVCPFKEEARPKVPGVVHVDGTGRLQTVTREHNRRFYDLIQALEKRTGIPIVLNTSFNVMGEPIIETPQDALWCMLRTGIDYCVLEGKLVTKTRDYEALAVSNLLKRIEQLKAEAVNKAEGNEIQANRLIESLHQATADAMDPIRHEVREHLGSLPPDLRPANIEKFWREKLTDSVWETTLPEIQGFLMNGGLLHSVFVKYPDKNIDWTAMAVEFLKAVTVNLNHGLVAPFAAWLEAEKEAAVLELQSAKPTARDDWFWFVRRLGKGEGARHTVSLTSLHGLFAPAGEASAEIHRRLGALLLEFSSSLQEDWAVRFLANLPDSLRTLVHYRNGCLHGKLGREDIEGFYGQLQGLFPRLGRFSRVASPVSVS